MKKEEIIERFGEAAYAKELQQNRDWRALHPSYRKKYYAEHRGEENAKKKKWRAANPDKVKANNQEHSRKGGKYYDMRLEYNTTGLQGERHKIRKKHGKQYRPFKRIIAPESQIHHEWIPDTAEYTGVALVETKPHRYGIIDVIQILEGKISLLTEE